MSDVITVANLTSKMNPVYDYIQQNRVLAKIEKAYYTKAAHLALDDFDLITCPNTLLDCQELHSLNIGHNELTSLPNNFGELRNIQHLSLEYNKLESVPDVIKDLQLKTLNVSHNPIHILGSCLGSLTYLEVLWCNNCCLTSLPADLINLKKLDTLGARHNKISKLPDEICHLENLRWLTLEDNNLSDLPKNFDKLQMLIHLNFNKNKFSYIPSIFAKLKNLKFLHMQSNEILTVFESTLLSLTHIKVNLLNNSLISLTVGIEKMFPNVIFSGKEASIVEEIFSDSDSSSDDWENSVDSSDLNYSFTESESEDEELFVQLPKLSKYLVTF